VELSGYPIWMYRYARNAVHERDSAPTVLCRYFPFKRIGRSRFAQRVGAGGTAPYALTGDSARSLSTPRRGIFSGSPNIAA
jgi:hypothetical protein